MNINLEAGANATFYDIHDNENVYIGKVVGQGTPEMHEEDTAPAKGKTAKKNETPKEPLRVTFFRKRVTEGHLTIVYQLLTREEWISDRTAENFLELFSGKMTSKTICWTGKVSAGNLVMLVKMMVDYGFVCCPEGYGINQIIESRFRRPDGSLLQNVKGGSTSKKAMAVIVEAKRLLELEI